MTMMKTQEFTSCGFSSIDAFLSLHGLLGSVQNDETLPARKCPKCGEEMSSRAVDKVWYYLCRNKQCLFGFKTIKPFDTGVPLIGATATDSTEKVVAKSKITRALYEKHFPLPPDPRETVGDMYEGPREWKVEKPKPSTKETLAEGRVLLDIVHRMQAREREVASEKFHDDRAEWKKMREVAYEQMRVQKLKDDYEVKYHRKLN